MLSSNCLPCINKPTRISGNSMSLIDNIVINNFQLYNICGIITADISDHQPIFTIIRVKTINMKHRQLKRVINNSNINAFIEKTQNNNWDDIYEIDSVQISYIMFHDEIHSAFERSFPIRTIKCNYKERLSWISEKLKIFIYKKIKLILNL